MSLTLYAAARSRGLRNLWLLEELGVPYTLVPVTPKEAAGHAELQRVNPNRRVPALDDDGFTLFESFAINVYLAAKYGGPLAPDGLAEDARTQAWTLWVVTEVEPHAIQVFYNRVLRSPADRDAARALEAMAALERPLAVLESALSDARYLIADRFTLADLNVAAVLKWLPGAGEDLARWPHVRAWLDKAWQRPAADRIWKMREAS